MPFQAKATETSMGRYIQTETVSDEIQEYAQSVFQSLSSSDFQVLQIDYDPAELKLSYGIKVDLISSVDYEKYYFPILKENQIVLTLIVNKINNELLYTIVKDDITNALNSLQTSIENPVQIVVSDTAIYAVDNSTTYELAKDVYATEASSQIDLERLQISAFVSTNTQTLCIDANHVFDTTVDQTNARTVVGRSCTNYPFVNNKIVNNTGTCWASCTASMIEYINNGSSSSATNAASIRDELLTYQTNGGINDAKTYISNYAGRTLTKADSYLSWNTVKYQILSLNNPCYMRLSNSSTAHATVLIGYDYENSDDSNYNMYLMDPNYSSTYITSYGSTVTEAYGSVYTWVASLYY